MALTSAGIFAPLVGGLFDFTKRFFPDGETLESSFRKLSDLLRNQDRRLLVIIDDIDRLSPPEALAIFRLVKSVGRLPNVIYLLVFDRDLAERAVKEIFPSEGPHFLEKIVQAGFDLPAPTPTDLHNAVLSSISSICGEPTEHQLVRFMNVFYDVVAPYMSTPRHVTRFRNAISVTWPPIAGEVNLADFIALETLRLYEPSLYNAVKANKPRVCGHRQESDRGSRDEDRFSIFLQGVAEEKHDLAEGALQRLFPRLESMGYGSEWVSEWSSERRVCVESHFDTYFRLSLSDDILSARQISELSDRANEDVFIRDVFQNAAKTRRRTGQSMVPVYLDELTTHAKQVDTSKIAALLAVLFAIHDDIDLRVDADEGFMAMANTTLRYHWLIRGLTRHRLSLGERTTLYTKATEKASLGWLVDFVSSARRDYQTRDGHSPTREEDCLTSEEAANGILTDRALAAIRSARDDGSLLSHPDLLSILWRWMDFMENDATEVRAWTDDLMSDGKSIAILARAMTGKSWTTGMGGFGALGDRVSTPSVTARITDDSPIVNAEAFRNALERALADADLSDHDKNDVQTFLNAWKRSER